MLSLGGACAASPPRLTQEVRFFALGQTDAGRRLFLAFTVRNQMMRVVSARDMSRRERKVYQHAQSEAAPEQGEDAEV
ncbi:MAG: BrnT family toxin [Chloroflexota bacterium]